jgi:hypothetical protein
MICWLSSNIVRSKTTLALDNMPGAIFLAATVGDTSDFPAK